MIKFLRQHQNTIYIIFFFIFINIIFLGPINDDDTLIHIIIGQETFTNKSIPTADFHSFTAYNTNYINQNWLSQVIFYLTYNKFNFTGVQIIKSCLIFLTIITLFLINKKNKYLSLIGILFLIPLILIQNLARPLLFTWLFSSIMLLLINQKKYFWIPLIFLFWVNIHAGFILGLIALFFYSLIETLKTRQKFPLIIFLLSFLATLANPYWYKIYLYPLSLIQSTHTEWKPLLPNTSFFWIYVIYALILIVSIIKNKTYSKNIIETIFIFLFLAFGFTAARQPIVIEILLFPLFIKYLSQIFKPKKTQYIYPLSCLILIVMFLFYSNIESIKLWSKLNPQMFPVSGENFLQKNHISHNIFNEEKFAGLLLLKNPNNPVFIDSREEIYQGQITKDYLSITNWENSEQLLDKYQIECIFISNDLEINLDLSQSPFWELVYFDDYSMIYLKKGTYPNIRRLKINPFYQDLSIGKVSFSQFNSPQPPKAPQLSTEELNLYINEYQYLLNSNPDFIFGYRSLSLLYFQKNDLTNSLLNYQKYISLYPQGKNDSGLSLIESLNNK